MFPDLEQCRLLGNHNMVKTKLFLIKALHLFLTVLLFYLFWIVFRYGDAAEGMGAGTRYSCFVTLEYTILVSFFNKCYNAYLFGYSRIRTLTFAQFLSQFFSLMMVYVLVGVEWGVFQSPMGLMALMPPYLALDAGFSYLGNRFYFHLNAPRKTLLLYRDDRDRRRFGDITGKPMERLYQVVKEIRFDGAFSEIQPELGRGYDAVFVAGLNSRCRNGILKYCEETGLRGFFLPHVGDVIMQGAEHIQAFDSPVMMVRRKNLMPGYRTAKRASDAVLAALGLAVLSPVFAVIAIAVKATDGGPVFYRQERLTKDGKVFSILKFRSMRTDAEKDGLARLSDGIRDERVTPVGRILRLSHLDELPQLWNILAGDMSFVGPRPERPELTEKYAEIIPDFKLRLQVKAGLTGYAQVYGKYNTDPYEKLEFDLMYMNHMSVLTDIKLMFATAGILFSSENTRETACETAQDYENE